MSKTIDILPLMVKDHCKIEKLLDEFEENADKDHITALKSFNILEWELEKHIFVEEKAIFKSMLVTKDGNYHKSYHLTINLKIRRRGRPPLPLSTLFFLPSRTTYLMGSFLKEEFCGEFSE